MEREILRSDPGGHYLSRPQSLSGGTTLVEIMVASSLLILALGLVLLFSQTAYRIAHEEFERTGVEQTLLALGNKLNSDFSITSAAGVSISPTGQDLLIHPLTLSDVGTVVYQDRLFLWHHDAEQEKLVRFRALSYPPRPFDGTPFRAEETVLVGLHNVPEFQETSLYPAITRFRVTNPTSVSLPFVGSPLTIELEAELELAKARKTVIFNKVIQLRNSGV